MKKLLLAISTLIALTSCKGKDGSPGLPGAPGAPAVSFIVTRSGPVLSDDIFVLVPGLNIQRGDILNVYSCLNTACVQTAIFQPGTGLNVFYIVTGSFVELINMKSAGNNLYYITALEKL